MTSNSHPFVLLHVDKYSTLESCFLGSLAVPMAVRHHTYQCLYCNYHYAGRGPSILGFGYSGHQALNLSNGL
jgi:hypothetical protein